MIQVCPKDVYKVSPRRDILTTVHNPGKSWRYSLDLVLAVVVDAVVPAVGEQLAIIRHSGLWSSKALHVSFREPMGSTYKRVCDQLACLLPYEKALRFNQPCHRHPTGSSWCGCSGRRTRCAPPAEACGPSAPSEPSIATRRWHQQEPGKE